MKPYISSRTRDAAMRALEDLPTDVLLDAMKGAPISDYRRRELGDLYSLDLAEHAKMYTPAEKAPTPKAPLDPEKMIAAMKYASAPAGPSAGERAGLRVRADQRAPEQGDPLGPMRVKRPDLPDGEMRVFDGMRVVDGGEDQASAEGGAE